MTDSYVLYKWPRQENWVYMEGTLVDYDTGKAGFVINEFNEWKPKIIVSVKTETIKGGFPETQFNHFKSFASKFVTGRSATTNIEYLEALEKAIACVNAGELKKVVISRREFFTIKDEVFNIGFKRLAAAFSNAFVYIIASEKLGTWFGASPEILVEENENGFSTMALAGTIKSESEINLHDWKQKEIEEQIYVKDYIADILEKSGIGFTVSATTVQRTGNIHHLVNMFDLNKSQQNSLMEIAKILHPTPAVCGFPLNDSKNFILEHESYNRWLYTGFLGPVGMNGNNGFFVNLRCGQKVDGGVMLYAGGGINKGSVAEDEINETANKMANILRYLR